MDRIKRETVERGVYVLVLVCLVAYGIIKDSDAAARLIQAIMEAFSILIKPVV